MLFVGPKGVGKATVARALARALHCPVAPGRGCGACPTCHRIDTDRHAGLEWIVPEAPGGKIKVEAARELATRLLLAPFEGDAHVVVFDPAEALTDQAFNAMLKTLEEPRPGVYFVLVASALDGLLPTILSRCATVRFGRLQDDDVAAALDAALAQRTDTAEIPAARRLLAIRLADGSPGAACDLALDPTLDATHALLREAAAAATRGPAAIFAGEASPLSVAWATATAGPPTGKPARERQAVMRTAELWLLDLRKRLRGRDGIPEIAALAGDRQQWTRATDTLLELQTRLERNANARLAFEAALLELWSDDRAGA
jgi:DNA polymerase-3 subunit delta'